MSLYLKNLNQKIDVKPQKKWKQNLNYVAFLGDHPLITPKTNPSTHTVYLNQL